MNNLQDSFNTPPVQKDPLGLAIGSLVLGIIAIPLSLFLIGGILGVFGLILGIVHLVKKRRPRGMAITGLILSFLAILFTVVLILFYILALKSIDWDPSSSSYAEWEGKATPDFTVTTLDGKDITISDLKGKRVVLDFWATWCPPCRNEIPHFVQLTKETPVEELLIIGISNEDAETLNAFVAKEGINYPIAVEPDALPEPFRSIQAIPTTFFIDRNGRIQQVMVGYSGFEEIKAAALAEDLALPGPSELTEPPL